MFHQTICRPWHRASTRNVIGLVVEEAVAEFEETSPAATRDDLIERIKRIERIGRKPSLLEGRASPEAHTPFRFGSWRDGQSDLASGLE